MTLKGLTVLMLALAPGLVVALLLGRWILRAWQVGSQRVLSRSAAVALIAGALPFVVYIFCVWIAPLLYDPSMGPRWQYDDNVGWTFAFFLMLSLTAAAPIAIVGGCGLICPLTRLLNERFAA